MPSGWRPGWIRSRNAPRLSKSISRSWLKSAPSAALWNNLGNHYLVCGDAEKARAVFRTRPEIQSATCQREPATGAHCGGCSSGVRAPSNTCPGSTTRQPAVRLLRAEALHWAGKHDAALALLDSVQRAIGDDERLTVPIRRDLRAHRSLCPGRSGVQSRSCPAARKTSTCSSAWAVPRRAPDTPDRARGALEVALRLRPQSVEVLVELGQVYACASGLCQGNLPPCECPATGSARCRSRAGARACRPERRVLWGRCPRL